MIFNHIKKLKQEGKKIGITFSTFDLLHAGHIAMLSEAKNHCDYLILNFNKFDFKCSSNGFFIFVFS